MSKPRVNDEPLSIVDNAPGGRTGHEYLRQ